MNSKLPWILAGIFGAFVLIVVVKVAFFPSTSDPTSATVGPWKLTLQKPLYPVTLVLPAAPSAGGDAGDDYRSAIQLYKQKRQAVEAVCAHLSEVSDGNYKLGAADLEVLEPVNKLIREGAQKKKMTFIFRLTPQKIEIPYDVAEAGEFQDIANVPYILSEHYIASGKENYPQAERCLLDLFTIGYHMMEERARMDTVLFGVGLQQRACELLMRLYAGKWEIPERSKQVKRYSHGLDRLSSIYGDHQDRVVWHLPPKPGDLFNLVENHADRCVRVEAILGLGVVKLTCEGRGNGRQVKKLIAQKLKSPDAIERAAAKCADALDQAGLKRLIAGK